MAMLKVGMKPEPEQQLRDSYSPASNALPLINTSASESFMDTWRLLVKFRGKKQEEEVQCCTVRAWAPSSVSICSRALTKACCAVPFRELPSLGPAALIFHRHFVCLSCRSAKAENKLPSQLGAH